ncbi:heavy metal sensor histidine kinase [Pseudomonas typographi]|uniref:Sensor protein n=1 Tax=Pseudomonas typographi TaxID=2715964 RepID=A0ABR7Z080_9PSED|nr:heavy metal sensor histidine kinase [Pseudomonas typographi]MBD1551361.1 heavy metal sensor histidine kinase [Pseudomonas typographi]MBD1598873.1 heavy metal sensor histidine kinase [Pseudomonas typographi]
MSRLSLTLRLAILLACFAFGAMATLGAALYFGLKAQLSLRDDAALVTRVDQIRTLLQDSDARELIRDKPRLFENMLGNSESLLVVRAGSGAALITVNPGQRSIPEVQPISADAALKLDDVRHGQAADGTPFIYMGANVRIAGGQPPLQVISGRLLSERTRILTDYRNSILAFCTVTSALIALLAFFLAQRSMAPLRRLTEQTAAISVGTLSSRIDQHRAPAELNAAIIQFNAMLDRLERGFTHLKQVSADMAHELRTPIGNMLGQIEVGLGKPRNMDYYQHLAGSNYEELQRLSNMIDNMLFLARTEHAEEAIERTDVDIADEFRRVGSYFEDVTQERGVSLAWSGSGTLCADVTLFRRALANLVANAVRHAQPGSEILMLASDEDVHTAVQVRNVGETIDPSQIGKLFDRFYRVDTSRQRSSERSGLGLSIVASIMQIHGGRCHVASAEGVTVFSLLFPRRQAA